MAAGFTNAIRGKNRAGRRELSNLLKRMIVWDNAANGLHKMQTGFQGAAAAMVAICVASLAAVNPK